ncbi:hypothetical protein GCM10023322_50340 [Rugosimonospora acidiphila]|uniref:LPXTG cell wall anchor domain-containing protein n=1 Tax=Rugosimonospora acidiphila TaxID=556531 RepID=A0ABP9S745_9ACTN
MPPPTLPADAQIYGATSGTPSENFDIELHWQKPTMNSDLSRGQVSFFFDSSPLATVSADNENYGCRGRFYGLPPAKDRTPGKHVVRATANAAGSPSLSTTYTIVAAAATTGAPTVKATRAATPEARTTTTKPVAARTVTAKSTPARAVTATATPATSAPATSAPGFASPSGKPLSAVAAASASVGGPPVVLASNTGTGSGWLAWLLVSLCAVGLLGGGALVVRRRRRPGIGEL